MTNLRHAASAPTPQVWSSIYRGHVDRANIRPGRTAQSPPISRRGQMSRRGTRCRADLAQRLAQAVTLAPLSGTRTRAEGTALCAGFFASPGLSRLSLGVS